MGGGGNRLSHVSIMTYLLVKSYFLKFRIETLVICNGYYRDISCIKAVLLWCEYIIHLASHGSTCPPPIQLGLRSRSICILYYLCIHYFAETNYYFFLYRLWDLDPGFQFRSDHNTECPRSLVHWYIVRIP